MATTIAVPGTAKQNESRVECSTLLYESNCTRCGGLMVHDFCTDLLSDKSGLDCPTWRCVQCGDVVDPVIRWNRHLQQKAGAAQEMKTVKPVLQGQVSA